MQVREQRPLRNVYEFFLSLNLAFAIVLTKNLTSPFFLRLRLQNFINGHLHLHPHHNVGGWGAFFILALGLALGIFVLLWLFSHIISSKEVLHFIGGGLSIAALPACSLLIENLDIGPTLFGRVSEPMGRIFFIVSFLEVCVAVLCVWLYLREKWFFNTWQTIALLSVHWIFWAEHLFGPFFWGPAQLVILGVGFASCLFWGQYVRQTVAN